MNLIVLNQNILNNFNEIKMKIEKNNNIGISEVKCLPNEIIHTNPIYFCKLKGKEAVIKFCKNKDVMKKESFCNAYLKNKGLSVPIIISYDKSPIPHIIMGKIQGTNLSIIDIPVRVKDLAKIHTNSLDDLDLNKNVPRLTKEDRIKNLERNIYILKSNPLILEDLHNKFNFLVELIKSKKYDLWEQCFCFNDFFINNSMKSKDNIYYFDFEKSVVSCPFVDVGCIVINYPKEYNKIKSLYINSIITNLKAKKIARIQDYMSDLNLFVDIGVCEKVIEDAAFLSNNSIKKTKDNDFCKKLAKKKMKSVIFIFDNLKTDHFGEK